MPWPPTATPSPVPTHEDRAAEATEIIAIAEAVRDGALELLGRRLRYVARLEQGDVGGVEEDMAAFARRAGRVGNPLYPWYVPLWKAQLAVVAGDIDAAEALLAEVTTTGRSAGSINAPMLAMVMRLAASWQRGDFSGALATAQSFGDTEPDLVAYLSSLGGFALTYALAGRATEANSVLDRAVALRLSEQPFDAEWLANMANLVRAAALLRHRLLDQALNLLAPHADLVSFEGIGAGFYGSVARIVALGHHALGHHDEAVANARAALEVNRRFGGTLVADALRTLGECLDGRARDGDRAGHRLPSGGRRGVRRRRRPPHGAEPRRRRRRR